MDFPDFFLPDLELAHASWHSVLRQGLQAIHTLDPDYLPALAQTGFLPSKHQLFAAFSVPLHEVRFVLVGEGPYPREQSANGYCFMDAAVSDIWSNDPNAGLSKTVNRATSLRNFIKMLLLADGRLCPTDTSSVALVAAAQTMRSESAIYVQTMAQLQANFLRQGFLMLNASLVFRSEVAPIIDAKIWQVFLQVVFQALAQQDTQPTLILWGKIADRLATIPAASELTRIVSEHPYNLSFIQNQTMQTLFATFKLLYR